ncbi:MAG: hypothetical protein ACJ8FT_05825 [Sphingomonas sp.]
MHSLSISAAWDETKAILARDGRLLATVALALVALPQVLLAVTGAPTGTESSLISKLVYAAVVLLGLVAQIAFNRLAIGPSVTVGNAITLGFARLAPVLLVFLVVVFGVAIIAALLVMLLGGTGAMTVTSTGQATPAIVGVLLVLMALSFAIFQLVFPIAAAETANPIRLIARSWQLAHRHYLRLLGFILVVFFGLGMVVFASEVGIGSLVFLLLGRPNPGSPSALVLGVVAGILQGAFSLVTAVMVARIYVQLTGRGEPHASVPSSGI